MIKPHFACIGAVKLKTMGEVGASGAHTYRTIPTPNADPARLNRNRCIVGTKGEVVGDVQRRIDALGYKPRRNAVPCLEFMLTTSPDWWKGKKLPDLQVWVAANVAWLKDTYGADNVAHVVLHLDERTPHLAAYVVPERKGRLNARDVYGGREAMRAMHTAYAAAMEPFGLVRGVEGSGAKHDDIKGFYGQVASTAEEAAEELAELGELTLPPAMPFWTSQEARQTALEGWKGDEQGKRAKLVQRAAQATLAAALAEEKVDQLKEANGRLTASLDAARDEVAAARLLTGLTKDQVAALRKADVSVVAARLGWMEPVRPKENAIDLVKRAGSFDYAQAVAWLHAEFGPTVAAVAVQQDLEDKQPVRPFTPAENTIRRAVEQQADALGCDRFRVTLVPADETKKPFLPGKSHRQDSEESFYSREELIELIPWLRFRNNQGDNILVTPMDDAAYYILLDDARVTVEELQGHGFQPCLGQRTSWDNSQVVFKVPRSIDRDTVLALFNEMNRTMGDEAMTGLRHPMRLAGFRNMKAKHEREGKRPFVQVYHAVNTFCSRCVALCQGIEERLVTHIIHRPKVQP